MTNPTPLSPAAQAVRRDFAQIMRELHQRCRLSISATDALPITLETNDSSLQAGIDSLIAAALRAAIDQVVPEYREHYPTTLDERHRKVSAFDVRDRYLAIADELESAS